MNGFRILIVEDNRILRELMHYFLREHHFLVEEAGSSEEALEKIVPHLPHLIILDNELPYKNGVDLYKILKKMPQTKDIPIFFCTACNFQEIQKQLPLPPEHYFQKPFDYNQLIGKINKILSIL